MLLLNFLLFFEFYFQKNDKKSAFTSWLPCFLFDFRRFHEKCARRLTVDWETPVLTFN